MLIQKYDGTFYSMIGYATHQENGKRLVVLRDIRTNELITVSAKYYNGRVRLPGDTARTKRFIPYRDIQKTT